MKRIVQLGGMLIALGMLFASCQMGTSDASFSGNSAEQESSNINGITIGIGSIDNNSRTILPADWTDDTASKLTYVLTGEKTSGVTENTTLATFSYSQLKNKTAIVNIEMTEWTLKLTGYISAAGSSDTAPSADEDKPCLKAEDTFDFSTGTKAITFNLKPVTEDDDTEATGSVNVNIAWLTTQPKRLELGIFPSGTSTQDIVSGAVSASYSETKDDDSFSGTDQTASHTAGWLAEDIPVGMYKFAAVFYNAKIGGTVIGYYIDWLYVDGGNVSKATVNFGDKFNTVPENPSWLAVETAFVPQEGTSTTDPSREYYAKFHWNDRSNNETGFELVITEKDGASVVVNPTELAKTNFALKTDKWYNGTAEETLSKNTLDAGSTWVVLKLEPGKLYTAKVRAINGFTPEYSEEDDDDIEFCKAFTRNGDGREAIYAPFVTEGTGENAVSYFGMFTVNYALSGGKVIKKKDSSTAAGITNYIVGYNYSSEQQDLMTDSTLVYPHAEKDNLTLVGWNSTTETKLQVIEKENIAPVNLTANWSGVDLRVSVTFPSYANAKEVKIASGKNTDNTVTFDISKVSSISVTAGENLTDPSFVLTDPEGEVVSTTPPAGKVWTWNNSTTNPIKAGIYCLQITGTYTDTQGSGRTLTLCGNVYIEVEN